MIGLHERKDCPYCGNSVKLGDCVIVATNPHTIAQVEHEKLPSGAKVLGWVDTFNDRLPVVAHAPTTKPKNKLARLRSLVAGDLPPLADLAPADDLPARLCPHCRHPLPPGLDDRPIFTVAVVGTNLAGKSHYLTSMIRDATRLQGMYGFGCTDFAPDELTAARYDDRYHNPVFLDARTLEVTQFDEAARFSPLVFDVKFEHQRPCLLMFHDVSGETLMRRSLRVGAASFVRRAAGVIFLVDPLGYPMLHRADDVPYRVYNQADLLRACVNDLDQRQRDTVPYAVTLSKSDMVAAAWPDRRFVFAQEPVANIEEWDVEMKLVEKEVRQLFTEARARDLLVAANHMAQLSFHAVSPIGRPPRPDGSLGGAPQPLRCLEPLVTVLHRIPGIVDA